MALIFLVPAAHAMDSQVAFVDPEILGEQLMRRLDTPSDIILTTDGSGCIRINFADIPDMVSPIGLL